MSKSGKGKIKLTAKGYVVKGILKGTVKADRLGPHFMSRSAANTNCDLLKLENAKTGKYTEIYVTEE